MTWGRLTLATEVVDVATILSGAVETMQPQFVSRNHALTLKIRHEALRANADPTRLTQIFCNLLDNAAKYTPDGGRIEVELRRDGHDALVRIEDSGIGIPDSMLTAIFEPFTQVKSARERARGGLGLGLPIVKKLVEMHRGSVEARSDGPGKGAKFVVKLPLTEATANEQPMFSAMPYRRAQTVLVVDDDRDTCETLGMMLEHLGCRVRVAHDADRALASAIRDRPDLVLLDIGLPELDGYEIARRLRELPELSVARVAALTGYAGSEDRRRAAEARFDAFLVKPVDFDALTRLLDERCR
jgi:CheY-like chemotaxis protein/two-component sensor histidine kinase